MKRVLVLLLLLSIVFSLLSCGDEYGFSVDKKTETAYYELGLYFKLPKTFVEKNIPNHEKFYSDGNGTFMYSVYSGKAIEETLGYDKDITVEEYTKKFIIINGLDMVYDYDAERNRSVIEYDYSYTHGDMEDEYYIHLIMRGSSHLYIITMCCEKDDYESTYKAIFDELLEIIYAD